MSKRIYILGILLLFVGAVSSCRLKEMDMDSHTSTRPLGNKIVFELGTAQTAVPQTRSLSDGQQGTKEFLCVEGNDSLYLSCSVVENNDPVFDFAGPVVKGAPATSENISEFYITANLTPDQKYFPLTLVDQSDFSDGLYSMEYYWPQATLDFFAANFYPNGSETITRAAASSEQYRDNPVDWSDYIIEWDESYTVFSYDNEGLPRGEFSYSLPEPNTQVNRDAEAQPDYAFAIAHAVSETEIIESNNGVVPLRFAHCFAAVTFKIGSEFMDPVGRKVEKVEVINVPCSGICNFQPDQNGNMIYSWNTEESDLKTYVQVIPDENAEMTNVANGQVINDDELTFMLIPHEISDNAKIRITFNLHADRQEIDHKVVVEKYIKDLFASVVTVKEWVAGKKYIYTLLSKEVVGLEISDNPIIGGNLYVSNTGTTRSYVRATIVGWWEDSQGDIVAPWNGEGQFTGTGWGQSGFTGEGSRWYKGEDGFYYYAKYLDPREKTDALFASYSNNGLTAPHNDAKLVLNVYTQSVSHHHVEIAWPDQASNLLSSEQ